MRLKHLATLFLFTLFYGSIQAQQAASVDSLKKVLAAAKTIEEKFFLQENLSRILMNVNQAEAEVYGNQLITMAEESRDRKLMIRAYMSNGIRNGYLKGQKIFTEKAIGHFEKALAIARQERMEDEIGAAQLQLAEIYLAVPDKDKALKYITEAFSRINTLKNDSLKVEANIGYGKVYQSRNEKIMSLRHFLTALRLAEEIDATKRGIQKMKAELLRNCYLNLSGFYNRIEDYDKAIDYYVLAYNELDRINDRRVPYQRCIDINAIGNLFANKKNNDIAISYFERSIAMADSLKFTSLKMPGYMSLLNQYLRLDQPQKAMDYLNSSSGQNLKTYLANFGMSGAIDQAYAYIYSELDQFDSARLYFNKALPFFEQKFSENHRVDLYIQLGRFYKKTGETKKAIEYFLKAKEVSERNDMLDYVQTAAKGLDTLYEKMGNFQTANLYNAMYYQYKDSSEKLNNEKELTRVEAADELQRQERLEREKLERARRRNNIQYMGITLGIVLLFISLVVLGMFKVSATTIKMIGFFTFLMFFEFIFLIFKKNIYSITHGEPWKDLLFMIGLAALLLPLHHWLEGKVIHYLTSHNRLTRAGHHIKTKLFRRTKEEKL